MTDNAVAIIGMACVFPGDVEDPASFWRLLRAGRRVSERVPASRFDVETWWDPRPGTPGALYATHGGFVADVGALDAGFFGISPREAEGLDPQQRMVLTQSLRALENACIPVDGLVGSNTAVAVGVMNHDAAMLTPTTPGHHGVTGTNTAAVAGRVSHAFGLRGPAYVVDTACSSSLAAVDMVRRQLLDGACELGLCGGVNAILHPSNFIARCQARMLSPTGRCHTFGAAADGYLEAEGCGMLVLKRLADAQRDGDPIRAVLRASGVRHDGASSGLTVPDADAQVTLMRDVLAQAKLNPADVPVLEAHGTGTPVGDPVELSAVREVFAGAPVVVGSLKANLGHLESAAGVASVIKAVLMLEHAEVAPHVGMDTPNRDIDFTGIQVPGSVMPFPARDGVARVGVSAFGISGTNAHAILEAAPSAGAADATVLPPVLVVSAATEVGCADLQSSVSTDVDAEGFEAAVATSWLGRSAQRHRAAQLKPGGAWLTATADVAVPRWVFMFTGQGSQAPGMGRALYDRYAVYREAVDACARVAEGRLEVPLLTALFDGPGSNDCIHQTRYAQPCLFTTSYALCALWASWGVLPAAVLGHSVGEFAAACAAGVLPMESALSLVLERGRLMQDLPSRGRMAAVFAPVSQVAPLLEAYPDAVDVAAVNTPDQTVISGDEAAVDAVMATLAASGVVSKPLQVSHAFHSPLMAPMLDAFEAKASAYPPGEGTCPFFSAVTGTALPTASLDAAYWRQNTRRGVRFADAVAAAYEAGYRGFLEVGPSATLTAMTTQCLGGREPVVAVASFRHRGSAVAHVAKAVGNVFVHGAETDFTALRAQVRPTPTLPGAVLEPTAGWGLELPGATGGTTPSRDDVAGVRVNMAGVAAAYETRADAHRLACLADHRLADHAVIPGAVFLEMIWSALRDAYPGRDLAAADVTYHALTPFDAGAGMVFQTVVAADGATVQVFSRSGTDPHSAWVRRVSCRVVPARSTEPLDVLPGRRRLKSRAAVAQALQAQGLTPGATFHWLTAFDQGDTGASGTYAAPEAWQALPYAHRLFTRVDAGLQLALLRGDSALALPVRMAYAAAHVASASSSAGQVALREGGVGDLITVEDEAGQRLVTLEGVEFQSVPAGLLDRPASMFAGLPVVAATGVPRWTLSPATDARQALAQCQRFRAELVEALEGDAPLALALDEPGPSALRSMMMVVAHEAPQRFGGVALPATHDAPLARVFSPLTPMTISGGVVITGGTGGLGLAVAAWCVARGASHVWLLARRKPGEDAVSAIDAMRDAGASVTVLAVDAGDPDAVAAAAATIRASGVPVTGVVHAAGALRDGLIADQNETDFAAVWAPKVFGAEALHTAFSGPDLSFFWLFSSVSALLGQPGQLNYAAANGWLDGFATRCRRAGSPVTSIQWGPWADIGMAASGTSRDLERRARGGLQALEPAAALAALDRLGDRAVVAVVDLDVPTFAQAVPVLADALGAASGGLDAGPDPTDIPALVRRTLATVLGVKDAASIDARTPFGELGLDSLMGLEVTQTLERILGVPIPPTAVLAHPTLDELVTALQAGPKGGEA